jgi:ribosome-dependent ATPase
MSPTVKLAARLASVSLRYRHTVALENVQLDLPASCIVGLIGPDGVGKSSLLALIAGARRIQAGTVETLAGSMADARHRERVCPRIAYMPQGLGRNLYASLSVAENLDFFGRLFGLEHIARARRIGELLQATGLAEFPDRPAGQLSGGMKQKLGLCCALIHDPDLLVLDEPTTGIDPLSRRQFWELIGRIRARRPGMSVIVATAYFDEAERFDHLVAMNAGRVLAAGTPAALKSRLGVTRLEEAYARLMGATDLGGSERTTSAPGETIRRETAIEARGLTRRFGKFLAVDHLDLSIARGEIFGFVGPNGCGKTTTMKMLTGLLPANEGSARLFGRPVAARDIASRSRVGFMSQAFSLYTELTVRQNLELHAHLFHLPRERIGGRIAELVTQFGLADYLDQSAEQVPLGVRQRLSLAVAVIHEPELLILDEPTSGVDPAARNRFWRLLNSLARERGVTIFISTHFMNEAERCDRVSLMYEGRILVQGPPAEITRNVGAASLEDAFIAHIESVGLSRRTPVIRDPSSAGTGGGDTVRTAKSGFTFGRLWAYARRELMELRRDPIRLAFATLGPVILMVVFGFGITFDVERLTYATLDRDQSPESRGYLENFSSSRYFTTRAPVLDDADLEKRLRSGELRLVVEIPPGFGRDLTRGRSPQVAVWLDGAFPFRAETTQGYVEGVHEAFLQELARESHAVPTPPPPADIQARFRYNQAFQSVYAIVPGTIMLLLLFMPAIMTALGVVREKELGSIVNFYVTPTTKLEFLLGKQLPYVGVALVNFVTLMALAVWLFHVPVKGSVAALVLGAVIYVISSTAFGLMVSNFVRTQIAAIFATAIVTTIPAIQYSGYLLPVSSMSADAQAIGRAFASTYFLHLSLGTFTKALEFPSLTLDLAALVVITLVITALARAALPAQEA